MIRSILAFMCLFSMSIVADHNPITEFPAGTYLGLGRLSFTNGSHGVATEYASYAIFKEDELSLYIGRDGDLFSYNLTFHFTDSGFFTVQAHENQLDDDGELLIYEGWGYCQTIQCHFDVDLGDRQIEETITFSIWENEIRTLGSMRYSDENGDAQAMSWEERFGKLPDHGDDDDIMP